MRKHRINDNKKFLKDYKRMLAWCMRNPGKPYPKSKWVESGVGLQNLYVLCQDYVKWLSNRDILIEFYNEQYSDTRRP